MCKTKSAILGAVRREGQGVACRRAGDDARRQRGGRRTAWRGALEPGLDQFVRTPRDFSTALVGFVLLTVWRASPLVAIIGALGGVVLAQIGLAIYSTKCYKRMRGGTDGDLQDPMVRPLG